ncbi:serine/threonine-protein kinase [Actinocorallia sp. B10E7]|uniref:serine/threonine-protein kinase n=1 Tax=Actinocorallia sp. B10E7 TaxID=3153558 RepID=UPI00325CB22E
MDRDDSRPGPAGGTVGDYEILDLVGRGGMAEVYRARDRRLERVVALKVLARHLTYDDRFRLRFIRESRTIAAIDHPHIIPIFEAGEADGLLFIAMRFVAGPDLRRLLSGRRTPSPDRTCRLLGQIASALDAAHRNALVHRDVKPANILVAGGGTGSGEHPEHIYLTDFGLTKSTTAMSGLTSQGQFVGTPRYIAPEQITGDPVDGRCDQYALACVAYEMLTGEAPFHRDSQLALLYAHVSDEAPPPTSHRPDLPSAVDPVLARGLAKAPGSRYPSCLEFVRALYEALGEPVPDSNPAARTTAPTPWPRNADTVPPSRVRPTARTRLTAISPRIGGRNPLQLIGAGVALLVAAASLAVLLARDGTATYPGSSAAPFSFEHPGSWSARTHSDVHVIASPAADAFEALFQTPVFADWSAVSRLDPEDSVGVFAGVSDTLDDPATAAVSLPALLPGKVTLNEPSSVPVAGVNATRYRGSLSDPQGGPARLDLTALVVPRSPAAAFLVYFCAPSACDPEFPAILASTLRLKP